MGVTEKGVIGKDLNSKVTFGQGESNKFFGPSAYMGTKNHTKGLILNCRRGRDQINMRLQNLKKTDTGSNENSSRLLLMIPFKVFITAPMTPLSWIVHG